MRVRRGWLAGRSRLGGSSRVALRAADARTFPVDGHFLTFINQVK
jgi:hypothetical protein